MKDYCNQDFLNNQYFAKRKRSGVVRRKRAWGFWVIILVIIISKIDWAKKDSSKIKSEVGMAIQKENEEIKEEIYDKLEEKEESVETIIPKENRLINQIIELVKEKRGEYGLWVESFWDQEVYGLNYDKQYTAASINKVPILIKYLLDEEEGRVFLSDIYKLKKEDIEEGSGGLQYKKLGSAYTEKELLYTMGKNSDNTATNAIVRKIGIEKVQSFCDEKGMKSIKMKENLASAQDMGKLFSEIYKGKMFESQANRQLFFDILIRTDYEERIPAGVPKETQVVHKIGNQIQVWSDCGLVMGERNYAICIMTSEIAEDEARWVLPEISRMVWEYEKGKS